jgi:hypothetical protein
VCLTGFDAPRLFKVLSDAMPVTVTNKIAATAIVHLAFLHFSFSQYARLSGAQSLPCICEQISCPGGDETLNLVRDYTVSPFRCQEPSHERPAESPRISPYILRAEVMTISAILC